MDEAARDFALCYNGASINDNVEYATTIYQVKTIVTTKTKVTKTHKFLWWSWSKTYTVTKIATKIQYTYKTIAKGTKDGVDIPNAPLFRKKVAAVHTHAAYDPEYENDVFSPTDIKTARSFEIPLYVATPLGILRRYDPSNDSDIIIFTDIPFDSSHPDRG